MESEMEKVHFCYSFCYSFRSRKSPFCYSFRMLSTVFYIDSLASFCASILRETPMDFLIYIGSLSLPQIVKPTQNGTRSGNCITLLINLHRLWRIYYDSLVKNLNVSFVNNLTKYTIRTHEYYKNHKKITENSSVFFQAIAQGRTR